MLLLHSVGAKSGLKRINPMRYQPISEDVFAVFATNRGHQRHPDWYDNLLAEPNVTIEGGEVRRPGDLGDLPRTQASDVTTPDRAKGGERPGGPVVLSGRRREARTGRAGAIGRRAAWWPGSGAGRRGAVPCPGVRRARDWKTPGRPVVAGSGFVPAACGSASAAVFEREVTYPKGHVANPMTVADVETKFAAAWSATRGATGSGRRGGTSRTPPTSAT